MLNLIKNPLPHSHMSFFSDRAEGGNNEQGKRLYQYLARMEQQRQGSRNPAMMVGLLLVSLRRDESPIQDDCSREVIDLSIFRLFLFMWHLNECKI
jgi:hypothetical protein